MDAELKQHSDIRSSQLLQKIRKLKDHHWQV